MASRRGLSLNRIISLFQIIPMLTILMETIWVYAWLAWFGQYIEWDTLKPHMSFISYLIIIVYAEITSRLSSDRQWSAKHIQFFVLPSMLVLLLIIFRINFNGDYGITDTGWFGYLNDHIFATVVAFASGLYFIWRGIAISRQNNLFEDLYRKFMIGLIFLIVLLVIWDFSGLESGGLWSKVGIYAFSYFGIGLLTLAITNLETLSRIFTRHQETVSAFRRRWSSMIVALIVILLLVALAVAAVFNSDAASTLGKAVSTMGDWLLTGITYLLWPFAFLASALYYLGSWLINLITHGEEQTWVTINIPDVLKETKEAEEKQGFHLAPELVVAIKWILVVVVFALVIYFLGRFLTRYWRSKAEEGVEEEHESLWSWSTFKEDIRTFLSWLFPWLRRRKEVEVEEIPAETPVAVDIIEDDREMNIREIYRALLRRGRLIGIPRRKSETTVEYAAKINRIQSDAPAEELTVITEAYNIERYGEHKAKPQKLTLLNKVWRALNIKLLTHGTEQTKDNPTK